MTGSNVSVVLHTPGALTPCAGAIHMRPGSTNTFLAFGCGTVLGQTVL